MYPELAKTARKFGYALAVHGSLSRDFDLICIPWTDDAGEPKDLVDEFIREFMFREIDHVGQKEHGRIVYTLSLGFGECFVDLSFMPRVD
jgi:hypothetical protein